MLTCARSACRIKSACLLGSALLVGQVFPDNFYCHKVDYWSLKNPLAELQTARGYGLFSMLQYLSILMASFWMQVVSSIMDASSYLRAIPGHFNKSLQTVIVNVCFYAHFCVQFCATPS